MLTAARMSPDKVTLMPKEAWAKVGKKVSGPIMIIPIPMTVRMDPKKVLCVHNHSGIMGDSAFCSTFMVRNVKIATIKKSPILQPDVHSQVSPPFKIKVINNVRVEKMRKAPR